MTQPDDKNQTTPVLAIYISTEPIILLFKPVNRPLKTDCSNGNTYNRLPQYRRRVDMPSCLAISEPLLWLPSIYLKASALKTVL